MIECQTLSQLDEIFTLACVVAMQEHENRVIDFPGMRTTKDARQKLEGYIATRNIDIEFKKQDNDSIKSPSDDSEDYTNTGSFIEIWVQDRITLAKKSIHAGTELNPFYLPDFIHQLS